MTGLNEQINDLNKPNSYEVIETLGVNETKEQTKENDSHLKSFFESEEITNESLIKDINLDSIDNEQNKNFDVNELKAKRVSPVPPIQISNAVIEKFQQGKHQILLPKENYEDIKLNFKGIMNTDKYRLNSANSKKTKSNYSESLPPSKLDVVVNISAIEIDKNALEINNEIDQKVIKIKKRISIKCLFHIISYILVIGLIIGLILHISG